MYNIYYIRYAGKYTTEINLKCYICWLLLYLYFVYSQLIDNCRPHLKSISYNDDLKIELFKFIFLYWYSINFSDINVCFLIFNYLILSKIQKKMFTIYVLLIYNEYLTYQIHDHYIFLEIFYAKYWYL